MAAEANQVVGPAGEGALVIIPTYNELENLPIIVDRLLTAMPGVHVLVVDDNSPDGTGPLADQLAADDADKRIFVLHRTEKNGLGGAYLAGFDWGLARDYALFVEMDADGSHAPEQLHRLFDRINSGADMVAGSRYIPGGSVVNWPWHRQFISRGGNVYSRIALGVKFNDITGGYRAYRRAVLEKIDLGSIESYGYCFQIDLAWRTMLAGFTVAEVPITFTERELGESKMSGGIFQEAFVKVGKWGMNHRIARLRGQAKKIG